MNQELSEPTSWLDRPLVSFLPKFSLENLIITIIILLAVVSRFYNVDLRVMSHDEVNHVVPSYDLYEGRGYRHDPVTHGPLQFHMIALSYFLLGDSDFSSRVPAVLFSIATVAVVMLAFRRYLGRAGGIIAGFLFLISPYLLFYGRYTRNEAFVALWGVLIIYAALRYLEKGDTFSLYLMTAVTVLNYCTKEVSFIYSAQLLLFLAFVFILGISKLSWESREARNRFIILVGVALAFIILALGVSAFQAKEATSAAAIPPQAEGSAAVTTAPLESGIEKMWVFLPLAIGGLAGVFAAVYLIKSLGWKAIRSLRSFDLLILQGTLILPQLSAFLIKMVGWDPLDYSDTGRIHTAIIIVLFFAISMVIGWWWNWRLWLGNAAVFYAIFTVFYTTFFTNGDGFFTGLVGSLGYWLSQQGVQRGSQPLYFYALIQIPMYEYLPAIGTLLALFFGARYNRWATIPGISPAFQPEGDESGTDEASVPAGKKAALVSVETETSPKVPTLALLLFWSVTSLAAYSVAGEKMPWLTVHIVLPMLLAGGWGIGYLVDITPWKQVFNRRGVIALLLLPILLTSLAGFFGSLLGNQPPFQGKTLEQLSATNIFILSAIAAVFSGGGFLWLLGGMEGKNILKFFGITIFAFLAVLTARAAAMASYINYDTPLEYLVYAHAARGPKDVLEQVEDISRRTTGGKDIVVAYDNDALYPYWWYFRDYPNHKWYTDKPTRELREAPLIIAGDATMGKMDAIVKDNYIKYDYMRLWWPNQDYFNLTGDRVWGAISDPQMRTAIFNIWFNRDYTLYAQLTNNANLTLETWQPSSRMRFYIRKDIAAQIWNYGTVPAAVETKEVDPYTQKVVQLTTDLLVGTTGNQPGQLNAPRGIAIAPDGSLYVADSRNHRIQHFSADGQALGNWGSFADVAQAQAPGGTFNEPWDLAVGADGSVFVTDTWNHRVQKFTADGKFVKMWGIFGQGETPEAFWGPRGLAIDSSGRLYVTDTGNKRVVIFDQDGNYLAQFGSAGVESGQFDEPVGITVDKDGNIYVADTWNQRIQVFSADWEQKIFTPLRSWEVDAWVGQSLENKPFIAVDENKNLFVVDPEGYRVLEFDPDGQILRVWGDYSPDADGFGMTSGVAVDKNGKVWVSDGANNRLLRFTLEK